MTISVGYIGLGNIGKPMCASLIKNIEDAQVFVYDVVPDPVQEMVELGGTAAATPAEIAEKCQQIGVCVRHDGDVNELLYDKGMLAAAKPGTIIAIHSTVTGENVKKWAAAAAEKEVFIIDAAITGGPHGAAAAELGIMTGGDEEACQRAEHMFKATAKAIEYCGPSGAGLATKLALNAMNFNSMVAATESVDLMKAAGLDPQHLFAMGKANGVLHPMLEMFITGREGLLAGCSKEDAANIFAPSAGLAEKDLGHALDLAQSLDLTLDATAAAQKNIRYTFLQEDK